MEDNGWIERFNSSVRGIIALMLVGVFCWRFLAGHVDDSLFSNILAGVIGYWFAQKAAERMMQKMGTTTTTATLGPTTTVVSPTPPSAPTPTPDPGRSTTP